MCLLNQPQFNEGEFLLPTKPSDVLSPGIPNAVNNVQILLLQKFS